MLLSSAIMMKVFTVFFVFWAFVLVALFVGVGALMKRRERLLREQGSGHSGGHH